MDKELTTSRIDGETFYLGQKELSELLRKVNRYYRYHHNNENPKSIIIPLVREVEGVNIVYERDAGKSRVSGTGNIRSQEG